MIETDNHPLKTILIRVNLLNFHVTRNNISRRKVIFFPNAILYFTTTDSEKIVIVKKRDHSKYDQFTYAGVLIFLI